MFRGIDRCGRWLRSINPVAVLADQGDQAIEGLLLWNVANDHLTTLVERDAAGACPDIAVVGIGLLSVVFVVCGDFADAVFFLL